MVLIDVAIFILVLSLLIVFHEAGHFVAAKACGIYVDRFSIGMPPRLFGFRVGETDYCISALPIGGYVKMAGQEDAPMTEEEREKEYGDIPPERWFSNKPFWQRAVVLTGGPFMNLVLAVLLYGFLAGWGSEVPEWKVEARIGEVDEGSPAASAPLYAYEEGKPFDAYTGTPEKTGWQRGDLVISLDGREIASVTDLAIGAILNGEGALHHAVVERSGPGGATSRYVSPIAPAILEDDEHGRPRFGVGMFETALVGAVREEMPAGAAGLEPGDVIHRANGELVDMSSLVALIEDYPQGKQIDLEVQRDEEVLAFSMVPGEEGRLVGLDCGAPRNSRKGDDDAAVVIWGVEDDFLAKAGMEEGAIQKKDIITEVNGQKVTIGTLNDIVKGQAGETVQVKIHRPTILFGLIQQQQELELDVPVARVRVIGIAFAPRKILHRLPAAQVVPEAFRQSYLALERTLMTIKALAVRDVSPKDIGGPVMIYNVTTQAAKVGWSWLVEITAFISINLCVFNLLPLPVLDGGVLLIHGCEAIRGKPLSIRFQENYARVGLLFIVALMLFVTWNDIGRLIDGLRP